MDIKHGDVITLDNGDTVKVSLEVINKRVIELVCGRSYSLQREGGQFCHYTRTDNGLANAELSSDIVFMYIGKITICAGDRHIFYAPYTEGYAMFGTNNLDFVIKQLN